MINQSTVETLKSMKLGAMATASEEQLRAQNTYRQLGFEERIGLMVDAEWNRHQSNKLQRFIKNAQFPIPSATIESIEYLYGDDIKISCASSMY